MITLLCFILIGACAFAMAREGAAEGLVVLIAVLIAGFVSVALHQPCADSLAAKLDGSSAAGTEDSICLVVFFCFLTFILRYVTQLIMPWQVTLTPKINQIGGGILGVISGWLACGILTLALAVLPWPQNSWGMDPSFQPEHTPQVLRVFFPSDILWISGVRQMSSPNKFGWHEEFDQDASYMIRMNRHRTGTGRIKPQQSRGEPYIGTQ